MEDTYLFVQLHLSLFRETVDGLVVLLNSVLSIRALLGSWVLGIGLLDN